MRQPIDYQAILEYYLKRSQEVVLRFEAPNVLKTDLFNEAMGYPIPGGIAANIEAKSVIGVEIDPEVTEKARQNYHDYYNQFKVSYRDGDIRALKQKDQEFDVILDLSTLDHVWPEEVGQVISEYNRVLKQNGEILLIVWVDTENNHIEHTFGKYQQKMIGENQLKSEITKYFTIEEERVIFTVHSRPNQSLKEFTLKKHEN